jgi:aminoglycoside phosphotransferase (APT) family kinase protein
VPDGLGVAVPRPLAVVPSLRLGLTEAVEGRPALPALVRAAVLGTPPGEAGLPALRDAVRAAGRAAAAVHLAAPGDEALPVRDLDAERALTDHALALLEPVWPVVAARLRARAAAALEAPGRESAPVLGHGDLTPGQVLLDASGRAGIVDLDTLCLAEPALDLGRFVGYLQVAGIRRSRDAWPLMADLSARFLAAHGETGAPAAAPERVETYRVLSLARLGASACWQLKDDRLAAVLEVLDAGDEWRGSATA